MQVSDPVRPGLRPRTARRIPLSGAKLRVLVVDDNQNAAHALAAFLSLEDMECCTACGGREAIAIGIAWVPHLVLMDISMPECRGFEAARALRDDPRTCGIAIIARTMMDETEVREHLTDDRFDGYVQKTQPLNQVIALLATLAQ
ncbi:response regulator receiver domain-containing protein [Paraburkholderia sp. BL23I1N1]|uniref:response regulator n=1 Tax=Paraburkholderia sp. BL23I1N1 TaxID=1938802 RepID=UPI000E710407|nr:response regulator [Paraburkholderia sp. BL23I1N1]RKE24342.1 response regulator receiver domain-containing protein [Paraburkholderia sp. BL23I1N1]